MSTGKETRVALVGAGYVSPYHIRALRTLPHVRIVGIADANVNQARKLAERFGIPSVFDSLSAMRATRPDVVHILTPPASHARLAIEALEMGCDVFVEKPMAPTAEECDEMIAAARRAGRALSVNHSAKDDPIVVRALELIRDGACGDVIGVDFFRTSDYPPYAGGTLPAPFRSGGYPFLDLGIHALYLMEAFLGTIGNVEVRYRSTNKTPNVFLDEWRGTVTCARGTGAFYLSWSSRPIRNEIFVHGTRANLHVDCFLQTCTLQKSWPGPKPIGVSINAMTHAARLMWHVPTHVCRLVSGSLRPSPGIHAGVLRFHDALVRGVDPPVTTDEGRRMVAWLDPLCREADAYRDRSLRLDEALEPRRILVTGASGTLGRALVDRLLREGESIRVLIRRPSPDLEHLPNVQVVYGDLGDPEAVDRAIRGVQLVYHLGATMRGRWPEFEAGTVHGTSNVVHACLRHKVERLVHVSSVTVLDYARQPPGAVVDESAPLEPFPQKRGAYTRAKLLAEQMVVDAVRHRGLQAVVVRPGQIVSPGCDASSLYGAIAIGGRLLAIGTGRLKLPLVHVNDVVDGLLGAATQSNVCGAIFHLVDSSSVTQREYVRARQNTTKTLRVSYIPRIPVLALAAALDLLGALLKRNLPLTIYRLRSIKELTFDCSAARRQLAWEPSHDVSATLCGGVDRAQETVLALAE